MKARTITVTVALLAACHADGDLTTAATLPVAPAIAAAHHHGTYHQPPGELPLAELHVAQEATARYRDLEQARRDGFMDLGVVIPHMGHHWLNPQRLDGTFDPAKPQLLVYSQQPNGRLELVAVEWAVPNQDGTTPRPEGFQGSADDWFNDPVFHLWTLHAWIWRDNPAGVFSPTNSTVP